MLSIHDLNALQCADYDSLPLTDGYYAGKWAFEQFTHWRVMLDNPGWYVPLPHNPLLFPSHTPMLSPLPYTPVHACTRTDPARSPARRIDSLAMAWRYPPYKPGHRAWIDMIYPALPARPKDLPAPPPAPNRHVSLNLWIALLLVGASSAVLTRYWPLLQLKA